MTGDQGSGSGREKLRPSFLPPVDGYPPPPEETRDPVPAADGERRGGAVWTLATILSGAMLLVSAFLPWARVQVIVELFGRSLGRDLGSLAGIDADGLVLAVPVLATVAIGLAFWDLVAREARAGPLAAVPGMLALFVCGVFVVRLDDVRDNLPQTGLDFGYQISVRYGWYLAVVTSLLVAGFSLVRSIADRVSGPRGEPDARRPGRGWGEERYGQYTDQPYTDQPYTGQPYTGQPYTGQPYTGQPYTDPSHAETPYGEDPCAHHGGRDRRTDPAGPRAAWPDENAAWPDEDTAWHRNTGRESPRDADGPAKDQS